MSDNIVLINQSFSDLYDEIDKGLSDIARSIEKLPDEDLTESKFKEFSRHLDGIQVQFDKSSDIIKRLTLDQSNPQLYDILEKKAMLNEKYGFFHYVRRELKRRFEKLLNIDHEQDFERSREERIFVPVREEDAPEEEARDDWDPLQEDEDALAAALLEADEQAEKTAAWEARQKDLAAFAQGNQKRRYAEQEQRAEAARQLGLRRDIDKFYSEAELRNERMRQDDVRIREAQAAKDRISREQAMFAEYRRRMDEIENFERLGKGHLDYSGYTGGEVPPPSSPSQNTPISNEQISYQYDAADPVEDRPASYTDAAAVYGTNNQIIYDWLRSPDFTQTAEPGHPVTVSSVIEQQMRVNVDTARQNYEASYGTEWEAETSRRYLQERRVYEAFHQEVKANHYEIYQPVSMGPSESPGAPVSYSWPEARDSHAAHTAPAVTIPVTQNRDIYDWIRSPNYSQPAEAGRPVTISPAIEQQMRINIDAARLEYETFRGSEKEAEAAQRYLQERRVYEEFHQEVNAHRYEVPQSVYPPVSQSRTEPLKGAESIPISYEQSQSKADYTAPVAPAAAIPVTQNRDIYDWIRSPNYSQPAEAGRPVPISPAIEQQMRNNVDAARLEYETLRGTDREVEAAQRYLQERRVYEDFHQELKDKRYVIPQPVQSAPHLAPTSPPTPARDAESAPASYDHPGLNKAYTAPTAPAVGIPVTQNRDIYDWIRSSNYSQSAEAGKPVAVSSAIEQQMRKNVEAAHLDYETAKRTDREAKAAQRYLQEQNAYEEFREKIRTKHFEIFKAVPTEVVHSARIPDETPFAHDTAKTPLSNAGVSSATGASYLLSNNKEIYDRLIASEHSPAASGSQTFAVSPDLAARMEANVEAARLEYEAARGTAGEQAAQKHFQEERSVFEAFRKDLREHRFALQQPTAVSDIPASLTGNQEIYDWIRRPEQVSGIASGAITVSSAIEQRMLNNVDIARQAYDAAKGTGREAEAAQKFLHERTALESFRKDIKEKRIQIAEPEPATPRTQTTRSAPGIQNPKSADGSVAKGNTPAGKQVKPVDSASVFGSAAKTAPEGMFVTFTPEGAEGIAVVNGAPIRPPQAADTLGAKPISPGTKPSVGTVVQSLEEFKASLPSGEGVPHHSIGNENIYAWLQSKAPAAVAGSAKAIAVSAAFVEQMHFNVEAAHAEYRAARGTANEQAAAHRYLQERNAFANFRKDVKSNRFVIADSVHKTAEIPAEGKTEGKPSGKVSVKAPFQSPFVTFTPEGAEGVMVENGKLTKTSMVYNNPGLKTTIPLSPDTPIMVHPEYEKTLHANMKAATAALNAVVAAGDAGESAVLPSHVSSDIKLAMQAYLGFRSAKAAGTVIISESAPKATPDYRIWQQQYVAKTSGKNISKVLGATGQYHGVNQNKVSKRDVKEISSLLAKKERSLKRQNVAGVYFSIVGGRFQNYANTAMFHLGHKMYQMMQNGEENALRTVETGRYYATSAYHVAQAIRHAHPVYCAAHSAPAIFRREYMHFGELTFLDKGALAKQINDHKKAASALGKEIRALTQKGSSLTKAERTELAQKIKQRQVLGHQLRKEISYSKYRASNEAMLTASKELKAKHQGFVTTKHVTDEIKHLQSVSQKEMSKKFGALAKVTDKSLSRKIAELEKQNPLLKAKIKQLQAKGSALTTVERTQLMQLIEKHKGNSLLLRKLKGLSAMRTEFCGKMGALEKLLNQMHKNKQAWTSGFYVLQQVMFRPILEGSENGAQGLVKGTQIATNRYVRRLVKKTIQSTLFVGKHAGMAAVDLMAPGTTQAIRTYTAAAKTLVKAQAGVLTHQTGAMIKTGANAAVRAAARATPPAIKTAASATADTVKKAAEGVQATGAGIRKGVRTVQELLAKTKVGQAASTVARSAKAAAEAAEKVIAAIKSIGAKAALIAVAVFLIVGVLSAIVTSIGGATSAIILGDDVVGGKTKISPYVELLEELEEDWEWDIEANTSLGYYDAYNSVTIKYSTPRRYNYQELIAMMYVKMGYSLSDESACEAYLKHLFYVSHTYSMNEIIWYCDGCDEREHTEYVTCPLGNCMYDPDGGLCLGHFITTTEYVCDGHMDLYITKNVLSFDELYAADEVILIVPGEGGVGIFDSTLGGVSAKYEAGGINPGKISSGAGDYGGQSYGTWQLSSKMGSAKSFVNWLGSGAYETAHSSYMYSKLKLYEPGTEDFNIYWRTMASNYYDEFQELQAQYMYSKYVQPFIQAVYERYGVNLARSKALLELAFSTSVQFGPGNTSVLGNINTSMSDEEIIKTCYAYKRDNVDTLFRSSSAEIRDSLRRNRFVNEEKDLLTLVGQAPNPGDSGDTGDTGTDESFWTEDKRNNVAFIMDQNWKDLYDRYFDEVTGKPLVSD